MNYKFKLEQMEVERREDGNLVNRYYLNDAGLYLNVDIFPKPSYGRIGMISIGESGRKELFMFLTCHCDIYPANGARDNSDIMIGSFITARPYYDCKDRDKPWCDMYYSLLEADKIIRELCPGYCILQAEGDIADYKRREELYWDETRRIDEILLDMFFKEKGIDPDEHEDEAIELTIDSPIVQEFLAYKEEYLKDHPDQTDNALREKYDLKIYGGSDEDISDIISLF